MENAQQSRNGPQRWVNKIHCAHNEKHFGQFSVFYVDDLTGRKISGREGVMFRSSQSALNGFILEMCFRLLSRDATFQDVTKKVHSGGWLGFSLSILDQILHLNSRNTTNSPRQSLGSDRLRLAPVRHFLSHLPSVPPLAFSCS